MRFGTEESFVRVGRTLATACAAVVLALLLAGCQSPEPAAEYTLAVASSPCAGAVVDVDGTQCTTPVVLHLSVGASIEVVAAETTSVAVGQRLLFAGWQDGERDPERAIVVGSDTVLTILLRRQYVVSLSADPDSVHPQDSSFWWPEDSVLLLTPWDASSYHFAQWRVGATDSSTSTILRLRVVGPTTVTECYRREHQLTVLSVPDSGLQIVIDDTVRTTPVRLLYEPGRAVRLRVEPVQLLDIDSMVDGPDARYTFVQWNGYGTAENLGLTMSGDMLLTMLARAEYRVLANTEPATAGALSMVGASDSGWCERNAQVVLSAPYNPAMCFTEWIVDGVALPASAAVCTLSVKSPLHVVAAYRTPLPGEPLVYHARMTDISYPQGTPLAAPSDAPALPDGYIISPGKYQFGGYLYDMTGEGLYRLLLDGDEQQRVVFATDLDALLSGFAWSAWGGTADLLLTPDELDAKVPTSKLGIWCDAVSRWACYLLWSRAPSRYWGLQNDATSHAVIEMWSDRWQHWVEYDLAYNAYFVGVGGQPLTLGQMAAAIEAGTPYDVMLLADDAGLDMRTDVRQDHQAAIAAVRAYYDTLMCFPMVVNGQDTAYSTAQLSTLLGY